MNKIISRGLTACLAIAGFVAFAPPAEARSVIAIDGRATYNGDAACFAETWGGVVQNCAGAKRTFSVPLVIDVAGTFQPTYAVVAPSAGAVECNSIGISSDGLTHWGAQLQTTTTWGRPSYIQPPAAYVPSGGFLFGACNLGQGAKLTGVVY